MGNIVTPDQGFLPVPGLAAAAISPYPWWLTAALAIWALLALLCCWLLLLLALLRYCCRRWRQRRYAADRKLAADRLFGAGGANAGQDVYAARDQHFATAPLPPVPPYALHANDAGYRDVYERHTVHDEYFDDARPYGAAALAEENRALDAGSESYSEEEISSGGVGAAKSANDVRSVTVISDPSAGGIKENIETNIERNITKNYIINEERNYFIQKEPVAEPPVRLHDQEVQHLPAPTVTTINMAAERIADDPNWENANASGNINDPNAGMKHASSEVVAQDPSLFQQNVRYEQQPSIFTHRPPTPVIPRTYEPRTPTPPQSRKLGRHARIVSDDDHGSTTSEMSGHDSESIYETIRVFTPKKQALASLEDEDVYKTAGIDEVEIEIKDLVRLQKAAGRPSDSYDDILSSNNMARRHITPRLSSASSSSTLNNLIPMRSQQDRPDSAEEKEETVTETVQTQQIQTTFRQLGQQTGDSAFFIPLTSSSTRRDEQQGNDGTIFIPVSSAATISQDEYPALRYNRDL